MKNTLLRILAVAFAFLLLGAADPIKTAPSSFGAGVTYTNGILTSADWQAAFVSWAMVDGQKLSAQTNVNWDGMREDITVVVDGMKLNPRQLSEGIGQVAAYILANPPQTP